MEAFIFILLTLSLLGLFRFQISGNKPLGLIDLKKITENWISDKSWISRLTPIFSLLVIIYNFGMWILNGVLAIVDILKYLFKIIKVIVSWIWNEILHPTIFLTAKLLWHYLILFLWKLFLSSISTNKIKEVFKRKNIIFSFKVMVQIFTILIFFYFISTLFNFNQTTKYILLLLFLCSIIISYLPTTSKKSLFMI